VRLGARLVLDERGLVGKLLLLWVLVAALVVVAAVDAGSIFLARIRTADIAQDAAFAGAEAYADTGERREALRAALAAVTDRDDDARIEEFDVTRRGRVTVLVTDRAATILVGRFGLLEDLGTIEVTETTDGS
jgi:hypothetical protein